MPVERAIEAVRTGGIPFTRATEITSRLAEAIGDASS
jgi:hypothetical protein